MPRVIVEVSGGMATVESSSDEVDVLFFDWDELYERVGAGKCAVIQDALYNGEYGKARDLVDSVYDGEPWPEGEGEREKRSY